MLKAADDYIDGVPAYISLGSGMYADMPEFLKQQFGGDTVLLMKIMRIVRSSLLLTIIKMWKINLSYLLSLVLLW